ncbi:MAG: thiamine pyrophosphate-dependent dehydrogenase E1 component subunit alpha [bacterium]|nr:thiamine pyrophosphate-dependent dehydrogenase E1 component subunit alpha [bacterium]
MMEKKISKIELKKIYKTMLRIRICEESLVPYILNSEIKCPVHLCSGQEAVAAGVCAAITSKDNIFGNHRSHGHFLAQGGKIKDLIAEIFGKESGCSRGRGGSMHICDPSVGMLGSAPIVAGTISLAVGCALASKIRKTNNVTISFFGDGATGEGVLYESLNFASLKKLPVIFACENNLYSTHLSIKECRARNNIFEIGKHFGIPGFRIDGNDVLKVYAAAKKAVNFCKNGQGPVFLEFMTYRLRGHVGADDNVQGVHTDIRPLNEIKKWKKKDPIKKFERYLLENNIFKKIDFEMIENEVITEVNDAYIFTRESSFPKASELNKYVFKS